MEEPAGPIHRSISAPTNVWQLRRDLAPNTPPAERVRPSSRTRGSAPGGTRLTYVARMATQDGQLTPEPVDRRYDNRPKAIGRLHGACVHLILNTVISSDAGERASGSESPWSAA